MSIEITQSNSATLDTFIHECVKNLQAIRKERSGVSF